MQPGGDRGVNIVKVRDEGVERQAQLVLVFAQRVRLGEKLVQDCVAVKAVVAEALELSENQVNIKATTEEGLGFTGSGEGISSQAVCLLETVENYNYDPMAANTANCAGCQGCPRVTE